MKKETTARIWREWRGFVLFVVIMLVFRSAIADWNHVPSGSMIPSILEGDRILVDKIAYDLRIPFTFTRVARWADPQRSDIITFESPVDGKLLVKRVIGIPGDVVALLNNQLIINGKPAEYLPLTTAQVPSKTTVALESILGAKRTVMVRNLRHPSRASSFGPIDVPQNSYLVLGDSRDNSQDYRYIGFIDRELILGKANSIAFSLDYDNYYKPRGDRFFKDLE
ncbi:MAG: signal peptidase I [Gammaproteobacteria bacterium]|nr:signal peptidase I [Gammaproteobacteria bacterium]